MIEDAPTSPRSSAIYYWGGDWGGESSLLSSPPRDDDDDRADDASWDCHRRDECDDEYDDDDDDEDDRAGRIPRDPTSRRREGLLLLRRSRRRRRHRAAVVTKFELSLRDEDDADHWMFATRARIPPSSSSKSGSSSSASSSVRHVVSAPSSTEEEEEEETVARNDDGRLAEVPTGGKGDDDDNDYVDTDFEAIPIVDLSPSLSEDEIALRIGNACRDVGFFYVINHGVGRNTMEGAMEAARRFFRLDLDTKLRVKKRKCDGDCDNDDDDGEGKGGGGYRGYFEIGDEDLENRDGTRDLAAEEGTGPSSSDDDPRRHRSTGNGDDDYDGKKTTRRRRRRRGGDFKEGFDCGLEGDRDDDINDDDERGDARVEFFGRNMWPDENSDASMCGFREALSRYQAELIELSDKLLLALGRSLNRDSNGPGGGGGGGAVVADDYFVSRSRKPMCTLRLLHYPPVDDCDGGDGGASESLGCGAHTDYGLFTILQQDSIGGLQVRNRGGRWIDARPLKGSFVINVGDMLSRWTDGEYASTVHRVVSRGGDRYSVPFFFNPDFDAVVKPLRKDGLDESERGPDDDGDGGCQTALEILKDRYNGTFTKIESKS